MFWKKCALISDEAPRCPANAGWAIVSEILAKANEAPCSELRGIEVEFAEANPPSHKASVGHLASCFRP